MSSLEHYLKKGWNHIALDYKKNIGDKKTAKQRNPINYRPSLVLKLLGAFREFYIDTLFKKYNKNKNNYYLAFGSTNILSDYDITIVGPDSYEIGKKIYESYLNEYKTTMAYSFDTNIYIAGFYYFSPKLINPHIQKNIIKFYSKKYAITLFNFQPINNYQKELSLAFVFLKLSSISFDNPLYKDLQKKSKELSKTLKKHKSIEHSYNSMFPNAKKLFSYLYNSSEEDIDKIFKLVCITQYYSIESYYTPSTVNIVVLLLQGKSKLIHLDKFNHICSILENLGDLNYHWQHSDKSKQDFMKISKYIYRIYYSLFALKIIKKSLKNVSSTISNRGNESLFKVKPLYEYINYKEKKNDSFSTFISHFIKIILDLLFVKHNSFFHL